MSRACRLQLRRRRRLAARARWARSGKARTRSGATQRADSGATAAGKHGGAGWKLLHKRWGRGLRHDSWLGLFPKPAIFLPELPRPLALEPPAFGRGPRPPIGAPPEPLFPV